MKAARESGPLSSFRAGESSAAALPQASLVSPPGGRLRLAAGSPATGNRLNIARTPPTHPWHNAEAPVRLGFNPTSHDRDFGCEGCAPWRSRLRSTGGNCCRARSFPATPAVESTFGSESCPQSTSGAASRRGREARTNVSGAIDRRLDRLGSLVRRTYALLIAGAVSVVLYRALAPQLANSGLPRASTSSGSRPPSPAGPPSAQPSWSRRHRAPGCRRSSDWAFPRPGR